MRLLPTTPLSLLQLLKTLPRAYFRIFQHTLLLVIVSSLGHLLVPLLFLQEGAYGGVASVGFILLTWYLYAAILQRSNTALLSKHLPPLSTTLKAAQGRFL